ncbi:hypothetical protein D3C79_887070 [compost metagenome]
MQEAGQPVAVHLAAGGRLLAVAGCHYHDGFQVALAGGLIRQLAEGGALLEGAVAVAGQHAVYATAAGQAQGLLLAAQDGTLFLGGQVGHAGSVIAGSGGECYSNRAHEQSLRRGRRTGLRIKNGLPQEAIGVDYSS